MQIEIDSLDQAAETAPSTAKQPEPKKCGCEYSDAWVCRQQSRFSYGAGLIACTCPCHRYISDQAPCR